ncbi:GntR family transcriptional regulator [Aquabacterium sp. OR-4]|uniref:GntR family transcriptional regulator n=1 Tax=Aquabacterium sp. OR-4 TaxID=2978127 RepID=UPI0021B2D710|nr:GntR family transcriptional regulator [Aquabacterium sp. OR-4]MDT7838333.1 GntR family transcriptional regulator [Aquabacterium sp. OR-4]
MSARPLPPAETPPAAPLPAPAPGFQAIEVPDLVARVEAQLRDAILDGRIGPGERIVEAELARQMGISRAPVREAARRLESAGLLLARPRHGFAVREFTARQVEDLYRVRITLELMACELVCAQASEAELAALLPQVDAMVARAATLTRAQRVAMDIGFHQHLVALSGNACLQRLYLQLSHEVQLFLALTEDTYGDIAALADTHRPIAQALARRDAPAACAALRHHLEVALDHVRALAEQGSARKP